MTSSVNIQVHHTMAAVAPLDEALLLKLLPALTIQRDRFVAGGPGGYRRLPGLLDCWSLDRRGRLCINAGLVPRVRRLLEGLGCFVDVDDRRRWGDRHEPDPGVTGGYRATEAMLDAVTEHPIGQLVLPRPSDLVPSISAICRRFPRARILIPTCTRKRAWQIWHGLRAELGHHVQFATRTWSAKARVVTTTYAHFTNPDRWEMVLLPTPTDLAGLRSSELVSGLFTAQLRVYALLSASLKLSSAEQLAIENVAGPVIWSSALPTVPVRVFMADISSNPMPGDAGLARKRFMIWFNEARNARIAAIALAFKAGDMAKLWDAGLLLNEATDYLAPADPPRVAVLVESTEHGRVICRLTGWPMSHCSVTLPTDRSRIGIDTPVPAEVVTAAYAARHGVDAHVVIRADGGESELKIRNFPPPAERTDSTEVIVVDFDDDFDHRARRDTGRRIGHYRRRGWGVEGGVGQRAAIGSRLTRSSLPAAPAVPATPTGTCPEAGRSRTGQEAP